MLLKDLSRTIKLLQQESALKNNSDSLLQSDSDAVQQFILVLEAGFIHGLKVIKFETFEVLHHHMLFYLFS